MPVIMWTKCVSVEGTSTHPVTLYTTKSPIYNLLNGSRYKEHLIYLFGESTFACKTNCLLMCHHRSYQHQHLHQFQFHCPVTLIVTAGWFAFRLTAWCRLLEDVDVVGVSSNTRAPAWRTLSQFSCGACPEYSFCWVAMYSQWMAMSASKCFPMSLAGRVTDSSRGVEYFWLIENQFPKLNFRFPANLQIDFDCCNSSSLFTPRPILYFITDRRQTTSTAAHAASLC